MVQPSVSPKKKLRVLIADDVQETRRNTRLMLATIDDVEVVAIAANGLQAIQLTDEQQPDILLLDINMPEMDGLTAYRKIAQKHPDIGCIIVSAPAAPIDRSPSSPCTGTGCRRARCGSHRSWGAARAPPRP